MSSKGRFGSPKERFEIKQVNAIKNALTMWGINQTKSAQHAEVWDSFVQLVCDVQDKEYQHIHEDLPQKLNQDPTDSMQEVFHQEICALLRFEKGLSITVDHLKERFPDLPHVFPFVYNKYTKTSIFNHQLSELGISEDDVDPLTRYTFPRVASVKRLYEQYVELGQDQNTAARAIVAHYACIKAKCVRCKKDSTIMYNGLDNSMKSPRSWSTLLCSNCGSIYAIKYVEDKDKISSIQGKGIMYGSSFCQYYSIKEKLPVGACQYVSIFCFEPTTRKGVSEWPVYVVQIDDILPTLRDQSFDNERFNKLYSRILLKNYSMNHWFSAPCFAYDGVAIAKDILDNFDS
jgi:hypothetical protein